MRHCFDHGVETVPLAWINSRLSVVVRSPTPFGLGQNGCWPFRGSQLPRAFPSYKLFFCRDTHDGRRAASGLSKNGRLFFCSHAFTHLLILLMSGDVHPTLAPCSSFPVQCALALWLVRIGLCDAAPAPNESIQDAHYSPVPDSKL